MPKHPTARKIHPQTSEPDDVFVARVLEASAWSKHHGRTLTIAGIGLLLLFAALLYYRNYRGTLREQAAVQLVDARQTLAMGNRALAIRDLESFLGKFGSTPAADEARLLLAQAYLDEGQAARAIEHLQPLADSKKPIAPTAMLLLAVALEADGQAQRAEQVYLELADKAELSFQQREALDAAARLRMQRGAPAAAAELYERVLASLPEDSQERPVYEMRLAEARAAAGTG